jgi:hypothetical protein
MIVHLTFHSQGNDIIFSFIFTLMSAGSDVIVEDLSVTKPYYADRIANSLSLVAPQLIGISKDHPNLVRFYGIDGYKVSYARTPGDRMNYVLERNFTPEARRDVLQESVRGMRNALLAFCSVDLMHGDVAPDNLLYHDNVKLMDYETATGYGQPLAAGGDRAGYFNPVIRGPKIIVSWQQDIYASLRTLTCIAAGRNYQENEEMTWNNTDLGLVSDNLKRMGYPATLGEFLIDRFLRFGPAWQQSEYSTLLQTKATDYPNMPDFWSDVSRQFNLDNIAEI